MSNRCLKSLYREALDCLIQANVEDAEITVLFVIEHVFEAPYLRLLSRDIDVPDKKYQSVFSILKQCISGVPLAYVLGTAHFNGSLYFVHNGVLIPRPETEELVFYATRIIRWLGEQSIFPMIFECGVGTGVISIELCKVFPALNFYGWHISSVAIENARKNRYHHHAFNLTLNQGDFFEHAIHLVDAKKPFVLVSNPPYISPHDFDGLSEHVNREPKSALVAEENGTAIVSKLVDFSIRWNAILICEIGHDQSLFFEKKYSDQSLFFIKDLSGHLRFLVFFPSSVLMDDQMRSMLNQVCHP